MISFLNNYNKTNIITRLLFIKDITFSIIDIIFSFIGIFDLIKANIIIKRSFMKQLEVEIIRKDMYINIWNNLGNVLNKWKKDIYPKNFSTTASMYANHKNCEDCEDLECYCEPWLLYIWPLILKYEEGVQDIEAITLSYDELLFLANSDTSDLIKLLKISKIFSEISLNKKYILKYSKPIYDLPLPLREVHDEIKGISREWKTWRGKINVVLYEMVGDRD